MVEGTIILLKTGETAPHFGGLVEMVPVTVDFRLDVTSGDPTSFLWDFGDGETSDLREPTHTFKSVGTFRVVLTVWEGSEPTVIPFFIAHLGKIDFSVSSLRGRPPMQVTLEQKCIAPQGFHFTGMQWNYGDGATGTQGSHTYLTSGNYNITLNALMTSV